MIIAIIASAIAFTAYGWILILVYQKGIKDDRLNKLFFFYILDMVLLQATYFGVSIANNEAQALLWYTLNIPISSSQVIIYYFFIRSFLGLKLDRKLVWGSVFIWILVLGISITFRSNLFIDIYQDPVSGMFLPIIGSMAGILSLPTVTFLGITFFELAKNYKNQSRSQQARIQYLFLSIFIVWAGMAANIEPALQPYAIDVIANIVSALLIAYAILRYQFLELHTVMRKGLEIFTSIVVFVIGNTVVIFLFTRSSHIEVDPKTTFLIVMLTVITSMVVLVPLRDRIQEYFGHTLFRTTYDGYAMIQKLSQTSTSILDLPKLSGTLLAEIVSTLQAKWGILLSKQKNGIFEPIAKKGIADGVFFIQDQNHPAINWIVESKTAQTIYNFSEIPLPDEKYNDVNLAKSELVILKTRGEPIGILWLGEKFNKRSYSQDDKTNLVTIANNIASTIDNARLYEELQDELKERKFAEAALRENEAIFSSFLEHSQVYVFFKDKEIRSLRLSKNYEEMLGMPIEELLGKTMDDIFPSELAKSMIADDQRILREGKPVTVQEEFNGRTYETSKFPIFQDGEAIMLAGITIDITERKQADEKIKDANRLLAKQLEEIKNLEENLRKQVVRDPLTGLFNRRYLYEMFDHELARAKRNNYPISVIMIDIDHFKEVNDTYGHQAGDEALAALGDLLKNSIRQGDIACRYGGDEFLIIMPGLHAEDAEQRAEMLRKKVKSIPINTDVEGVFVTASIGIALYPEHGDNLDQIMKASDDALYEAKYAGRNRISVWKDESGDEAH